MTSRSIPASEATTMPESSDTESSIGIPGTSSHFIDPTGSDSRGQGRFR